nr:MAG TPA: hypothetical protein [Caudoviricetes sp.]
MTSFDGKIYFFHHLLLSLAFPLHHIQGVVQFVKLLFGIIFQ